VQGPVTSQIEGEDLEVSNSFDPEESDSLKIPLKNRIPSPMIKLQRALEVQSSRGIAISECRVRNAE